MSIFVVVVVHSGQALLVMAIRIGDNRPKSVFSKALARSDKNLKPAPLLHLWS